MKKTAYEKRIKRRITGRGHVFFAACSPGLKTTCLDEMHTLGFSPDQITVRSGGIEFKSRIEQAMVANLHLRSALRILMRLAQFKATSFSKLIKKIDTVEWVLHLPVNCRLKINVTAHKSRLYHSDAIAERIESTILEQLEKQNGFITPDKSSHTLFVRVDEDRFTLSLDTTGDALFKRGIKTRVIKAPLRENIAAAMLIWSGLGKDEVLIDPMCGSGTFSIEAAMIKNNIPPGLFRSFAFQTLPGFSQKTFHHLKDKAMQNIHPAPSPQIFASDIDEKALTAIAENITENQFNPLIQIKEIDFFDISPAQLCPGQKGVIALNPPYGKRLEQSTSNRTFYTMIRKKLISDFKGWKLVIILPSRNDFTLLGLNLALKPVFHGGMDAFAGIGTI